jgi:hypothetical protein
MSRYNITGLAIVIHPPPRKHLKYRLSKDDTSKKRTVHQRRRRPIKDLGFHPEDSPRYQNNASTKVIARHNQCRKS